MAMGPTGRSRLAAPNRRPLGRWLATWFMLSAATVGTVATSRAVSMLEDRARGAPVILDPAHQEATARFAFSATPSARRGWERLGVHLDVDTIWTGLPEGSGPEVVTELTKISPPVPQRDLGVTLSCIASSDCIGEYEVTFRWPGLITGQVRVEWSVWANITYEKPSPPEGAEIGVEIEPDAAAESRAEVLSRTTEFLSREQPQVVRRVRVNIGGPDANRRVFVELFGVVTDPGGTEPLMTVLSPTLQPVLPQAPAVVPVPRRCRTRDCSFSFPLVIEIPSPDNRSLAHVTWGVTAAKPIEQAYVSPKRVDPPKLSRAVDLPPLRLTGSGVLMVPIRARLSAEAFPAKEFQGIGPVIQGWLWLSAPSNASVPPGGFGADVTIRFPNGRPRSRLFDWGVQTNYLPLPFVVVHRCRVGRDCDVRFRIRLRTDPDPAAAGIELQPRVEVAVTYPRTGAVPNGARLRLEVPA
jgi:hypothetical protein